VRRGKGLWGVRANTKTLKTTNNNTGEERGMHMTYLALLVGDVDGREDPDIYREDLGRSEEGHVIPAHAHTHEKKG
jgi:hypothetical protein